MECHVSSVWYQKDMQIGSKIALKWGDMDEYVEPSLWVDIFKHVLYLIEYLWETIELSSWNYQTFLYLFACNLWNNFCSQDRRSSILSTYFK